MDIPGMHQVQHGSFFVCRRDSVDKALTKSNWSANVYPGVTLTMTVILTMLKLPNQRCPKPSCGSQVSDSAERGTFITCPKCGLLFRYDPEVEALGLSTEEDKLRLIQQDADMGRFGRRSVPADVVEIQSDEEEPPTPISLSVTQPSKPPAQALSLENLAALQTMSSNGYSKKPKNNSLNPQLPSIDWNSGTSGMAAWLNSSAIPDHGIETQFPASDTYKAESDQFRQARKDIEALKRVQFVSTVPKTQPLKDTVKEYQAMALNAQIYVRKIIDRFPKIAPFLARRFANANVGRLSRLPQSSGTAEAPAVSPMEVES